MNRRMEQINNGNWKKIVSKTEVLSFYRNANIRKRS